MAVGGGGAMKMMRTRFKRGDLAFHFEHVGIEMLLRHPKWGRSKSQLHIWVWSSEDIYACRW